MRAIALVFILLFPPALSAFDYAGDETFRREAGLVVAVLAAHGFPEPDAVALEKDGVVLTFDGAQTRAPLPPNGGTLVEPLIAATLGFWGPSMPPPLARAALDHLAARTRGSEWAPRSLDEALLQAFLLDLIKDDPERLGGLWEATGRGDPWTGMERFFAFRFGFTPEAFFARSASRALPHLISRLDGLPQAAVEDGEAEFVLPPAPPLSASALDLRFPSGPALGMNLAWDGGTLPGPTLLLVLYGPPLRHFDLIDLSPRYGGVTLPLAGVERVILLATSPAFGRPAGPPTPLRAALVEGYPCRLVGLELSEEEGEATLAFATASMADVAAFVVLRGSDARPGRLEPVGFLPGLGETSEPFAFSLVDPDRPPPEERPAYHLYAITADGLMAHQGSFSTPAR